MEDVLFSVIDLFHYLLNNSSKLNPVLELEKRAHNEPVDSREGKGILRIRPASPSTT